MVQEGMAIVVNGEVQNGIWWSGGIEMATAVGKPDTLALYDCSLYRKTQKHRTRLLRIIFIEKGTITEVIHQRYGRGPEVALRLASAIEIQA